MKYGFGSMVVKIVAKLLSASKLDLSVTKCSHPPNALIRFPRYLIYICSVVHTIRSWCKNTEELLLPLKRLYSPRKRRA